MIRGGTEMSTTIRKTGMRMLPIAAIVAFLAIAAASPAADAAFRTGVQEYKFPRSPYTTEQAGGILARTGGSVDRVLLEWSAAAPTRPVDGTDPSDPAYRWSKFDEAARIAEAMGGELLLSLYSAPTWAEGANRPTTGYGPCAQGDVAGKTPPCVGSWKPDPVAFGQFGTALARRYSGSTPDPLRAGRLLPRVRLFEAWNEPNYKMYLSPQCSSGYIARESKCTANGRVTVIGMYRTMLNSFYDGVKSAQPTAVVSVGGLGPYGASSQGYEVEPQYFARSLMCLGGTPAAPTLLASFSCPVKAKMDALAFHPYTVVDTPTTKAWSRDGAALGNSVEVRRALDFAVAKKTILPAGQKELWATELGWFTCPPCDYKGRGLSSRTAAASTAEMLYRLWAAKASVAIWFAAIDEGCFTPGCTHSNWPGGLFYYANPLTDAAPKPALQAFRFPSFSVKSGTKAFAWAMSPCRVTGAKVSFQALNSRTSQLTTVATATLGAGSDGVVKTAPWTIPANTKDIRASVSGAGCSAETSVALPIAAG